MATFVTSDGLRLHYSDSGQGVPVLCLAGLTRNSRDFDYVTPYLDGVRLIKLDYRGRGDSEWDENWQNYSLPVEGRDALELLDHLQIDRAAVLGTSRGGLIGMGLGMTAKDRLCGVALNDIGPVIEPKGLSFIMGYLGRDPGLSNHVDAARGMEQRMSDFKGVPFSRWMEEAVKHFKQTDQGLRITYDPKLRTAVEAQGAQEAPDLWPFFDALEGLPLAAVRGENSNLLSTETFNEMQKRRPDMVSATVIGRGHVPFLDEPEAVATLQTWVEMLR
jgi:pimeloyl-ACP methyl ester carboxylesterase